ncbi:MAG TPA: hypothetical protein VIC28_08215 [Thermoanaerobaculia bacterium]
MYIVALHYAPGTGEVMAGPLADASGKTLYEARARLSDPQGGPAVIGNFAEIEPAYAFAGRLRANGIIPILLTPEEVESDARRFLVRSFELGEQAITAVSRRGETAERSYSEIDLVLRGVRIEERTEVKRTEQRKFSPVRAIVTGGMILTKTTRKTEPVTTEEREDFLHLYAGGEPPLVFRSGALNFRSLGAELRPSTAANYSYLVEALRRALPHARYDERLASRQGRARILGPSLAENLDVAVTLLARVLRQRS